MILLNDLALGLFTFIKLSIFETAYLHIFSLFQLDSPMCTSHLVQTVAFKQQHGQIIWQYFFLSQQFSGRFWFMFITSFYLYFKGLKHSGHL